MKIADGARHVAKCQVNILAHGKYGVTIAPGERVNLDYDLGEGKKIRDVINVEWFADAPSDEPFPGLPQDEE